MKFGKQIAALRQKRNAHLDAMTELSDRAANENRSFSDDETKAWDKDQAEVRDIDGQLIKLEEAEQQFARTARPAPTPGVTLDNTTGNVVEFKPAFKAQAFTRFVGALALSKGNLSVAAEIAKRWDRETPEVSNVLRTALHIGSTSDPIWLGRAAVAIGTTTDPTWAAPLVQYQRMVADFIELLRPETIIGRLTGYRSVPFNIKIPRQTAGATANWVGEGLSKPVSRLSFDDITMPWAKVAVIVVITQELARFSTPSAEQLVRDDLIAAVAQFLDSQFIDPTVAPVAGLKPGSITNGVVPIPSSPGTVGGITTDLATAMLAMSNALQTVGRPVWLMSPAAAMYLATLRTAQDVFAFPSMSGAANGVGGMTGLSLMGVPVIVSNAIPVAGGVSNIILLDQSQLMIADDGETTIDTSTEASLQADSAPATPPTPLISLWQQNLLGIKAERYIYWMIRRAGAVQIITGFPGAVP